MYLYIFSVSAPTFPIPIICILFMTTRGQFHKTIFATAQLMLGKNWRLHLRICSKLTFASKNLQHQGVSSRYKYIHFENSLGTSNHASKSCCNFTAVVSCQNSFAVLVPDDVIGIMIKAVGQKLGPSLQLTNPTMELFSRRRWTLVSAQVVSCCVYKNTKH